MEKGKLHTEVDLKYFKERAVIEKIFKAEDAGVKYCYLVSHKGVHYIVRGFKIRFEHAKSEKEADLEALKLGPIEVNEVYQEYAFLKSTSIFNPHLAKPLELDTLNKPSEDKNAPSYMYIEILFDHSGVPLNEMGPLSVEMAYNLVRQSSYALFMLHNTNGNCFGIRPEHMVYDKEKDMVKIIDMSGIFGSEVRKKAEGALVEFESENRLCFPEYAPPEVLRMVEKLESVAGLTVTANAIDVYNWAMNMSSLILNRTPEDLKGEYRKFKLGTEEDYKNYLEFVGKSLEDVKTNNSTENDMKAIIKELLLSALSYKPNERPTTREIVSKMKEFEKAKNINIKFAETEATNAKHLMKLLMLDTSD